MKTQNPVPGPFPIPRCLLPIAHCLLPIACSHRTFDKIAP